MHVKGAKVCHHIVDQVSEGHIVHHHDMYIYYKEDKVRRVIFKDTDNEGKENGPIG